MAGWKEERKKAGRAWNSISCDGVTKTKMDRDTLVEYKVGGQAPPYVYALFLHENQTGILCQFGANHRQLRGDQFTWQSNQLTSNNIITKHIDENERVVKANFDSIKFIFTPYRIPQSFDVSCGEAAISSKSSDVESDGEAADSSKSSDVESDGETAEVTYALVRPILAYSGRSQRRTPKLMAAYSLDYMEAKKLYDMVAPAANNDKDVLVSKEGKDGLKEVPLIENEDDLADKQGKDSRNLTENGQSTLLYLRAALDAMSAVSLGALYQIILERIPSASATKSKRIWEEASIADDMEANIWLFKETSRLIQKHSPIRLAMIDGLHRVFSIANVFRGQIPTTGGNSPLSLSSIVSKSKMEVYLQAASLPTNYECLNYNLATDNGGDTSSNTLRISNAIVGQLSGKSYVVQQSVNDAKTTEHINHVILILREVSRGVSFNYKTLNTDYKEWKLKKIKECLENVRHHSESKMKGLITGMLVEGKSLPVISLTASVISGVKGDHKASLESNWLSCVACMVFWFSSDDASSKELNFLLETRGGGFDGDILSKFTLEVRERFPLFWKSESQVVTQKQIMYDMINFTKKIFLWDLLDLFEAIIGPFANNEENPLVHLRSLYGAKRTSSKPDADKWFDDLVMRNIACNMVKVYTKHGFFEWNDNLTAAMPKKDDIKTPDDTHCQHNAAIFKQINKGATEPRAITSLWELPPCSSMKTSQVFTVITRAIKKGLLQPSMALERNTHFKDATGSNGKKIKRTYHKCTFGDFEPKLSLSIDPRIPEKLKGGKSILNWASVLLECDKATADWVIGALQVVDGISAKTGIHIDQDQNASVAVEAKVGAFTEERDISAIDESNEMSTVNKISSKTGILVDEDKNTSVTAEAEKFLLGKEKEKAGASTEDRNKSSIDESNESAKSPAVCSTDSPAGLPKLQISQRGMHARKLPFAKKTIAPDKDGPILASDLEKCFSPKNYQDILLDVSDCQRVVGEGERNPRPGTGSESEVIDESSNTKYIDVETNAKELAETSDTSDNIQPSCNEAIGSREVKNGMGDLEIIMAENASKIEKTVALPETGDSNSSLEPSTTDVMASSVEKEHGGHTGGTGDNYDLMRAYCLLNLPSDGKVIQDVTVLVSGVPEATHASPVTLQPSLDGISAVQKAFPETLGNQDCDNSSSSGEVMEILDEPSSTHNLESSNDKTPSRSTEEKEDVSQHDKPSASLHSASIDISVSTVLMPADVSTLDLDSSLKASQSEPTLRKRKRAPAASTANASKSGESITESTAGKRTRRQTDVYQPTGANASPKKSPKSSKSPARSTANSLKSPVASTDKAGQKVHASQEANFKPATGHDHFIEELAYQYCTNEDNLEPLPKPLDFLFSPPQLDDGVLWSIDEKNRIVTANFSEVSVIDLEHKRYLGQLMERDDITVISEGLHPTLKVESVMKYLKVNYGSRSYHNFRQFDQIVTEGNFVSYQEKDGQVCMKVSDYVNYLNMLQEESQPKTFSYVNGDGKVVGFEDVTKVIFYMLDVDMQSCMHWMDQEFKDNSKMKETLPGGAWCMMNYVSPTSSIICEMRM